MGKFSDYLLVSDFDRTMTNRKSEIPPQNLEAVSYFMAEGGAFTIATGRSLPMSRYRFRDIPMNAPLLAFNGAACYDLQREALLFCHPLHPDGTALMQYFDETCPDLVLEVHCLDAHYLFHPTRARQDYLQLQRAAWHQVPWEQVPARRINFALYSSRSNPYTLGADTPEARRFQDLEQKINAWGRGRYTAINSMPGMVEVQTAESSKGLAARELANRLGRSRLICAGDAPNDLSMLREADLAFLAGDADPIMDGAPFRRAAACGDGTVADVIRQLEDLV